MTLTFVVDASSCKQSRKPHRSVVGDGRRPIRRRSHRVQKQAKRSTNQSDRSEGDDVMVIHSSCHSLTLEEE
jgi:hypothetical protein